MKSTIQFPEVVYKPYGNILSVTKVKRSEMMTSSVCFRYVTHPRSYSTVNALSSSEIHNNKSKGCSNYINVSILRKGQERDTEHWE
jgi:hypothetical protein